MGGTIVAYQTMMRAHQNGMAVVGRYFYEIAEMFHDALKCEGIICDIVPVGNGGECTQLDTQPLITIVTMILKGEKRKKPWYGTHG
jgi:hypothetical protein